MKIDIVLYLLCYCVAIAIGILIGTKLAERPSHISDYDEISYCYGKYFIFMDKTGAWIVENLEDCARKHPPQI